MGFFGFGKGKSGGPKKPAANKKRDKKKKQRQRLVSIKNLHLNPTIEDSLYKTLAEGVNNPDEPYISIATIDNEQFIYELALTDELIHKNGFDKGEPNIISQIKTGLALTGKHGNDVPKGLVNGSFFFDLDPEEGTEAQIVFVPTVSTLRRLEDLGGEDAKYQLVIIPADIDADNYDDYYQEGLINSPLQDDNESGNRLVTIDEFKSLSEEGAGSPDLQENEGVEEELDENSYIAPPNEQASNASDNSDDLALDTGSDDLASGAEDNLASGDDLDLASGANDDLASGDDLDLASGANDDLASGDDLDLASDTKDDLASGDDLDLASDTKDDLASGDDLDLASGANDDLASGDDLDLASGVNDDLASGDDLDLASGVNDNLASGDDLDLASDTNDDLTSDDLDLASDTSDDLSPAVPAKDDPLASKSNNLALDTDDTLDLPGNEDGDDGLDGFLSDEDDDEDDEFVGYDGKPDQGPVASEELVSNKDGLTVANDDEPEEVPYEDDNSKPKSNKANDDDLDELDDDDSESTDNMLDGLTDDDDDWDEDDDEPVETDEKPAETDSDEDEVETDEKPAETDLDEDEVETDEKPTETDLDEDEVETDEKPAETDSDEDKVETDEKPAETDSDKDEVETDEKPAETAKSKKKKSSDNDSDGEGNSETKPTAKDLGYTDINKQNLDSFIRQNIIQLDNALDGLDARLFPIDVKHDTKSMIAYKTMYNSLLEAQAKREKELIRTKFKHQLTQLLDPYVNHTTFSENFPKIDSAFQEKLFNPEDIDTEKAAGQAQIESRYKELHQKLIDDAIAKAEDDYANNYEPVKKQELEEVSKAVDANRRQKYDQAVDRVLNKAFYLNEAKLSKEAQKLTSRFITNDVAEANFELTNKTISYSEEMMRYMQFDKMIDARMGSTQKSDDPVTQKVDDSVMRQTIEDLQNRLNRQLEENKNYEEKLAALQSEINKAKTEPKPVKTSETKPVETPKPVLDDSDDKVPEVIHDELKTGKELLTQLKQAMIKENRKKPAKEIIKTAELDDGKELLTQLKQAMIKDYGKKPAKEIIKTAELDEVPEK